MSDTAKTTDPQNPLVPSDEKIKAVLDKAAKLDARILECTRKAFDPSDKLKRQVALGEAFVERARFQKENTGDWSKKAYSSLATDQERIIKLTLGINEVRLDVSAKIYGFVEFVKAGNPLVENVSYYRIANHFLPMFSWDVKALEGSIDPEWLTFIRSIIDDNAETKDRKPMPIKDLAARIETEKERRAKVEASKPNDAAGKALEQAAKAAATREKNARIKARDEARDGFIEAAETLRDKGEYSAEDMAKHLIAAGASCGVELTTVGTTKLSGAGLDMAGVRELMQSLFDAGKIAEIAEMVKLGQQMIGLARQAMKDAA